jgi:SAM-dependent methyltransferase
MGFYARHVAPRMVSWVCGLGIYDGPRRTLVSEARGRVLEIGMGSGHNLRFYDPAKVEMLWGLEPDATMRRLAAPRIAAAPVAVRLLDLPGEEIPLEDDAVDTVLSTLTMCTIPDLARALAQVRRVLKPGGALLFLEHGEDPEEPVRRWQRRLEPAWKRFAGGCHLTRPIPRLIEDAGFRLERLETWRLAGASGRFVPSALKALGSFDYAGAAAID